MALPGQEVFTSKPPVTYTSQHMYIGAIIIVNSFVFELVAADEYALRYMEIHDYQASLRSSSWSVNNESVSVPKSQH